MSIIDDVVNTVSKEVNKVQERGQEMFQSFNLNQQLRELERKRSSKLVELGRLIVDRYHHKKEISEETIQEKVNEVVGYEDQIAIIKAELETLKGPDASAPSSQRSEHKAGFKPTPGYECARCHAPASKDKKFCPACGESLGSKPDDGPVDVETEPETNEGNGKDED